MGKLFKFNHFSSYVFELWAQEFSYRIYLRQILSLFDIA